MIRYPVDWLSSVNVLGDAHRLVLGITNSDFYISLSFELFFDIVRRFLHILVTKPAVYEPLCSYSKP